MAKINYRWAITNALDEEMARDDKVFIIGEDVAETGGSFGLTRGLLAKYGERRVKDTPVSEEAIAGLGVGAAAVGLRPVIEIMFMDFIYLAMDQIANHAAKMRYMYGGQVNIPLVVRTLAGGGFRTGMHHSQSLESMFGHVPGLKVVYPSNAYDVKGLLKSAIRDPDPVIFLEQKSLMSLKEEIPEAEYLIPIGKGKIVKEGSDVTIVALGSMVHLAKEAARTLEKKGINVEIIDPRTVMPIDSQLIIESLKKTSRLVIVHEAPAPFGFGSEIAALISEHALYYLDAPIKRVTSKFVPLPVGRGEDYILPSEEKLIAAVEQVMKGE
ncbi:alpha-ketoacid dehydrogenase subunit beta [Bacillus rubiinfantis]|uniref:alpha-ketoacid dehydrogenase subunit beta n=1 Tax=Bacillus rubiinfantis TaxID=1499680 RepID=UPI0005AB11A7|nr:alpha-ketoacid dehydrogenase subunit beta [Bacillus rubiinfantis]